MPLQNELQRLHHLDALLRRSTPGNASDLAERLGVSRRTLFRYFEQLSDWGAEIAFCRRRNRYGYHKQPVLPALPPPPLYLNEIFFQKIAQCQILALCPHIFAMSPVDKSASRDIFAGGGRCAPHCQSKGAIFSDHKPTAT